MAQLYLVVLLTFSLTSTLLYQVSATDPSDDLDRELNYPQQLVGWNSGGGEPCEVSWKGISCNGSSVIFIQLNGLQLSGRLGDLLFNLVHLKQPSSIHIYGEIPACLLPPNATYIDLSFNDFSKSIPYSLMSMKYLRHLNISHDSLSGPVGTVFTSIQNLKRMDLPNNSFTGDLPTSFQDLKNLTTLFLMNNSYAKDLQQEEDQLQSQPDQQQKDNGGGETGGGGGAGAREGGVGEGAGAGGGGAGAREGGASEGAGAGGGAGEGGAGGGGRAGEGGGDAGGGAGEGGDDNGEQSGDDNGGDEQGGDDNGGDEQGGDEQGAGEQGQYNGAKETDSFCKPDDPKVYRDTRRVKKNERSAEYFHRKSKDTR